MYCGVPDGRRLHQAGLLKSGRQSALVNTLLAQMYFTVAELVLIDRALDQACPAHRADALGRQPGSLDPDDEHDPSLCQEPSSRYTAGQGPRPRVPGSNVATDTAGYCRARDLLGDWKPDQALSENLAADITVLPLRHLPPGGIIDLHWQVLAWCEVKGLQRGKWPCYWTTRRCYRQGWKEVMKFRPETTHAQCQTCYELRSATYNKHSTPGENMKHGLAWREHLRLQYADRSLYGAWKFAAREFDYTLLCIIIAACDKAKGAWPHWLKGRCPKDVAHLRRLIHDIVQPRGLASPMAGARTSTSPTMTWITGRMRSSKSSRGCWTMCTASARSQVAGVHDISSS